MQQASAPVLVVNLVTITGCVNDVEPKLNAVFDDDYGRKGSAASASAHDAEEK